MPSPQNARYGYTLLLRTTPGSINDVYNKIRQIHQSNPSTVNLHSVQKTQGRYDIVIWASAPTPEAMQDFSSRNFSDSEGVTQIETLQGFSPSPIRGEKE